MLLVNQQCNFLVKYKYDWFLKKTLKINNNLLKKMITKKYYITTYFFYTLQRQATPIRYRYPAEILARASALYSYRVDSRPR